MTDRRPLRSTAELPPPEAAAKVLVVDDDFAIVDGLSELLENEGFSIIAANNGVDALSYLRSGRQVDVIVLDVMMPMMDGWDFRAEQLADPSLRDIPVVLISASGFSRDTLQRQFNVSEVLAKPLDPDEFLDAMKVACGGSDAESTSSSTSMQSR